MQIGRRLKFAVSVVGSATLLTACAPPPSQTQGNLSLQGYQLAANPSANRTSEPTTTATETAQTNMQPKGETVKTLADFSPIQATEATITTSKGDITFTLFADKAPLTVTNFLTLAKAGFYDGIKFHRIIPDFMAQVGDPYTKDETKKDAWGTGGPEYTIADEFNPELKHDSEGIVSMANVGQPNTGGSQFFITFAPTSWLDGKHAVFGKVTSGMDVLRQLEIGDQIVKISYK